MMNKYLELYLKAYTNKVAADDSIVDDAAVGAGSGLFGGLAGYGEGYLRGEKLRQTKAPKIEHALNRIRARLNEIKPKLRETKKQLEWDTIGSDFVKKFYKNNDPKVRSYESKVKEGRRSLDKLEQLANKNNQRYFNTWRKASKLQKAIKNSRRIGGFAGAFTTSLLGTLLYNKLKKD